MGVQVVFDYNAWIALFPQFGTLTQGQIVGLALPVAEQYVRNDGGGPVTSATVQTSLLNLMVAHVSQLLFGVNGQAPTPLVGRISNAAEGSVSVGVDFPVTPTNAWFMQTPFGAMFWQATAPYRTMRYLPGPQRFGRGAGYGLAPDYTGYGYGRFGGY